MIASRSWCGPAPLAFAAMGYVGGCGSSDELSVHDGRPQQVFTIETSDGSFTSISPASLIGVFGTRSHYEISAVGAREGLKWSVLAHPTVDEVERGSGVVALADGILDDGLAIVQRAGRDGGYANATAGSFEFTLGQGTMKGSVKADPPLFSGTFEGPLSVQCWVPINELPPDPGTTGTGGAGNVESRRADKELASPRCAAIRAWRGP